MDRCYPIGAKCIYGPFAPPETAVCVLPPEGCARGYYDRNSERYLPCLIAPATHVVLPSWDPVLPLLVKDPAAVGKDTLYARLQGWVLPRTLTPIPYQLPACPVFRIRS